MRSAARRVAFVTPAEPRPAMAKIVAADAPLHDPN